ncbi:MAG: addiction module toxin RelE [Chloroflexota bacterium]
MTGARAFAIFYAPVVKEHLRPIERRHYAVIKEAIELHLAYEPDVETMNRKPLGPTTELEAEWELQCGRGNRFRVFDRVDRDAGRVDIVAIGVKRGNRLRIGREEVKL